MATITNIQILNRIGQPGAPLALQAGQLAYNQPDISEPNNRSDVLYVGDGLSVLELVGAARQLELWGDQVILPGATKTIGIDDLKITGGQANWLLQTDGHGNLSFTNAPGGGLTEVATDGVTLSGLGTTAEPLSVVANTVAVATDSVTIEGNGTTAQPLAVIHGAIAMVTDGVTLSGNGTLAQPLAVAPHSVAIATTGSTLTGNGTTASPLAVAIATNSTLTGNGTTGSPLGVVAQSVAVATDGITINGNGTAASPLQAVNGTVAIATDGVTLGGSGVTASPLHVMPNTVPVATNASLTGNGTTASPLGLVTPVSLQDGGTGVSASSNATLLTALGAASVASLAGYLQISGGTLTGALTLAGNATANLQPVTLQQMNAAITTGTAGFLPLAGGTSMTGLFNLSGNATGNLNPVPLQQLNTALASYMPLSGGAFTGAVTLPTGSTIVGYMPLSGGTFTGAVTLAGNAASALQAVPLQQLNSGLSGYLPLTGGTLSGSLTLSGSGAAGQVSAPQFIVTPGANFYLLQTGGNNLLNWAANWYDAFNTSNNTRFWSGPSGTLMSLNGSGNLTVTGTVAANAVNASGGASFLSSIAVGVASGQTLAINATGPITTTGQINCANCMPQGGNNTGSVGASGQAWFQVVAQTVTQTSDPRLKKDIAVAPAGALAKVLAIAVKNFRWLEEAESVPLHTGWDATDVQASLGNVPAVSVGVDPNQTLGINTMEMLAWLWQAVQELAQQANIT